MNRTTTAFCAALAAIACWAAPAEEQQAAALAVPLPPLARVSSVDAAGQAWQQSGEIGGSVASATAELSAALGAGGWSLSKRIAMGKGIERSELMIWVRQKRRILFMVWEKEAGTCGFAWGEER